MITPPPVKPVIVRCTPAQTIPDAEHPRIVVHVWRECYDRQGRLWIDYTIDKVPVPLPEENQATPRRKSGTPEGDRTVRRPVDHPARLQSAVSSHSPAPTH